MKKRYKYAMWITLIILSVSLYRADKENVAIREGPRNGWRTWLWRPYVIMNPLYRFYIIIFGTIPAFLYWLLIDKKNN